jgi:cell division septation protein DedD
MRTYEESEDLKQSDTEITLGTSSILGIFIGLALICGIFFGFGYSLGRTHTTRPSTAAQSAPPQTLNSAPSPIKTVVEPADGSTTKPAAGAPIPVTPALTASTSAPVAAPAAATAAIPGQVAQAAYNAAAPPKPVSATLTTPQANSNMVQIAAVSRPEDATVLVSALKGLGYNVSVRSEPTDKLYHVQVGPFATRDEAMAMRAKLINDGYNAILK